MLKEKLLLKIRKYALLTMLGVNLLINDIETSSEAIGVKVEDVTPEEMSNYLRVTNNAKKVTQVIAENNETLRENNNASKENASDILSTFSGGINSIIDIRVINEEEYIKAYEEKVLAEQESKNKYYDIPCEEEYQDYLRDICLEYNVPFRALMTIGHNESGGNWDTNGVISATNDLGQFQINEGNVKYINENLGYTYDDLLNDKYKNAHAAVFILSNIVAMYEENDFENIFGTYNGWTTWQKKEQSLKYVEHCMDYLEDIFTLLPYDQELAEEKEANEQALTLTK